MTERDDRSLSAEQRRELQELVDTHARTAPKGSRRDFMRWSALAAGASETLANAMSSSPVFGLSLCASICGSSGCSSGGTISTRISCAVTASRRCAIIASNRLKASDLYSCNGSRWP